MAIHADLEAPQLAPNFDPSRKSNTAMAGRGFTAFSMSNQSAKAAATTFASVRECHGTSSYIGLERMNNII